MRRGPALEQHSSAAAGFNSRACVHEVDGFKTKKRAGGTEGAAKQWWSFLKPATNEVGRIYPPLTI
jgi:hypothetical protein